MDKLIICDTLYQVIVAIQLTITIFKSDKVDIWISDHSNNTKNICDRLNDEKIFREVKYINSKGIVYANGLYNKLSNIIQYGFDHREIAEYKYYDEVLFYGVDLISCGLFHKYLVNGHKAIFSRFEEGLFSYENDFSFGSTVKAQCKIEKFIHHKSIVDSIQRYYCFFPGLKEETHGWDIIRIPGLDENKDQLVSILKRVFRPNPLCKEKYIYFASSSDIDGKPFGEKEIVAKLASIVGKENLAIKIHPRDVSGTFENSGARIIPPDGVPWEVYQICENIDEKILITTNSGSFVSISALQNGNNAKFIYLYKCVKDKPEYFKERIAQIDSMLIKLKEKHLLKNTYIVSSFGEMEKIIMESDS